MKIITNGVPRETSSDSDGDLSFRYKGETYSLDDFSVAPDSLPGWDGAMATTYFSGILVRFLDDDMVIVGRYYE